MKELEINSTVQIDLRELNAKLNVMYNSSLKTDNKKKILLSWNQLLLKKFL